eukprot:scaffold1500_cov106-Skeletonema_dohrnii-CCMP3373.AAC.6
MTDIDAIWSSLKSEDNGNSILQNLSMKKSEGISSKRKKQIIAIKQQKQSFDIDSFTSSSQEVGAATTELAAIESVQTKECEALTDNLCELAVAFSALDHDSDDEEDEETQPSPDKQPLRTQRLASALKSNDIASQIESVSKLQNAIKSLLHTCNDNKQQLQAIMDTCGKALFQLLGHKSEQCRRLSLECIQSLLLASIDLARHLPYLIPSIVARYAPCAYDKEMEVFVQNQQVHDFFKRGGASNRQDRDGLIGQVTFNVFEPNEDLRLALCHTIKRLVDSIMRLNAAGILEPYYSELIMALQTSLKDPFPEVKIAASHLLAQLLRIPQLELGAKYFATGLARAVLPNCRNRNTAVVVAAMDLLEASIVVPDRAKQKGAGSAAIADLVGFKADNSIPIAAFYDSQYAVSVNILAELSSHKNSRVRLRCCKMLQSLLIDLPDRYDHEQRLLPYVLLFINDTVIEVTNAALECIDKCGEQYERDHSDEIIERRQFGVDGDDRIDYNAGLPTPFTCRPSLGARLFVRNNTSRFFLTVLGELTNWRAETRLRSAELLLILAVFCEEHLTKDLHRTLNNFAKAIDIELLSHHEHEHLKVFDQIEQVLCLMAKFVDPATYLRLVRPRMTEDSVQMQRSFVVILSSLIKGASFHRLCPHWVELLSLVSSPRCIGAFAGSKVRLEGLKALRTLCHRTESNNVEVVAHFKNYSQHIYLGQAFSTCVDALEELTIDSEEENVLALSKECLDRLHVLSKVVTNSI